jgi:hypothetical protein
MATILDYIEVCDDCLMAHANGYDPEEWGYVPDPLPWTALPTADVAMACEGDGEDCGFSWRDCDGCGSTLGGTRHRMAVFAWDRCPMDSGQ